jgi:hypothetical protein
MARVEDEDDPELEYEVGSESVRRAYDMRHNSFIKLEANLNNLLKEAEEELASIKDEDDPEDVPDADNPNGDAIAEFERMLNGSFVRFSDTFNSMLNNSEEGMGPNEAESDSDAEMDMSEVEAVGHAAEFHLMLNRSFARFQDNVGSALNRAEESKDRAKTVGDPELEIEDLAHALEAEETFDSERGAMEGSMGKAQTTGNLSLSKANSSLTRILNEAEEEMARVKDEGDPELELELELPRRATKRHSSFVKFEMNLEHLMLEAEQDLKEAQERVSQCSRQS